ncbi:restriction endonuclease subunit S [Citrobacter sp. Cy234]|uniref:restriction endonuclease subunit S n=1 Tax=Citrobacter TaxID=544 RepID=UPI000CEDA229|nr:MULTISPECIES: restriction endonuclease subunit S [Citrobacter]EJP6682385.1 restriction endonuclease subunit S [Escherichia coli]ELO6407589.1 restriction endonuclease subunit S [Escherichia coli]MDM2724744.1 restriction endonuclease subunit S [Citrobacter sp. Cy234]PPS49640.1 hypothetical protein BWR12_17695 [Citrobacter braakii]WOI99562.1 restriction endonuclease subunit S [Citrobacter koseri]
MSKLSYLEKLLNGVKVEYKALWEVTSWDKKFNAVDKFKQPYVIKYHYFLANELKSLVSETGDVKLLTTNVSDLYTTEDLAGDKVSEGEVIAIPWGGNAVVQYYKGKFLTSDNRIATSNDKNYLNNKYLYYFLLSNINVIESFYRGSGIKHPSMADILDICIPIPPIEIQSEIVRVLDNFTSLTAELTAELTMRKKQYNYYRDKLLGFENDEVDWKTLPEIALDFGRGKSKHRPRNDEKLYGGDIPFIQTGDIRNASHIITRYNQTYSEFGLKQSKLWPKGTLCITIAANIAETSILGFDACFPDSVIGLIPDPRKTSSGYVEYLLQSIKSKLEAKGKEKSSAQSNINLGTFEQLKLPFPSLAEQARIVAILDKFETMTNSLVEGLPREIDLRQKQYEYYRNLLLSFPKSNVQEVA